MDTNEDNVIDAEIVDNLPVVIERQETHARGAPIEGRDWSTYSRPERRCTAHSSRTGEQCKNVAIKGHNVCRFHGGAARQIKQAARNRLDNAADRMARELLGIALAGESDSVRLVAIRDALDRSGITKPQEVVLGLADTKPYQEVFDGISAGVSRDESRRARGFLESDAAGYGAESVERVRPTQGDGPSQTQPPTQARPGGSFVEPCDSSDYSDLEPEYVARDDISPTYQHRADPAGDDSEESSSPDAPPQEAARVDSGRERHAQPPQHIVADEALRVAADLRREQLAIESPHRKYRQRRPW